MSEQDKLNQEEAVEEAVSCEQENEGYLTSPDRYVRTGSLEVEENESEKEKEETVQSDKAKLQQLGAKGKLVRSLAVCEESSLPPTTDGAEDNQDSLQITSSADKPSKDEGDREQEKDKNKDKGKSNEKPKIKMLSKGEL
ncbi:UNVERIFIED_CONTAM: hypothetical protein FKN15_042542 [Acipenser sinensis]